MSRLTIEMVCGDIGAITCDAFIALINANCRWVHSTDTVIKRYADEHFHTQVAKEIPLKDGQVILATSVGLKKKTRFANVLFVVDNQKQSLSDLLFTGLKNANERGYREVIVPSIFDSCPSSALSGCNYEQIAKYVGDGVRRFLSSLQDMPRLQRITFVTPPGHEGMDMIIKKSFSTW